MNVYKLEAVLLLPFRGWLPGSRFSFSGQFSDENRDTEIALTYTKLFQVLGPPHYIDASLCTVAEIRTSTLHSGDKNAAKAWARNHGPSIIADKIIPCVNACLLQLKRRYPKALLSGNLRSVGDIDLIYSCLNFEGENILCRSSPGVSACQLPTVPEPILVGTDGAHDSGAEGAIECYKLSKEWTAITRAVDLSNHGFLEEAMLVSFALLDALAQDFLTERLPNLKKEAAELLIRTIETGRLRTFFGPLMRMCLGESPLDQEENRKELDWLNRKRNAIIHDGDDCSRAEAQRGITTVWRFLRYLSSKGANYSLPETLEFWTPVTLAPKIPKQSGIGGGHDD